MDPNDEKILTAISRYYIKNILYMLKPTLLLLLLIPMSMAAQRNVDLDKFGFAVEFRTLPTVKIDSTYRTYNVEVESTKLMSSFMNDLNPERSVILEGWRKLPHDGHIQIKVILDDLLPESFSTKERIENIKDKNGVITGTRTYYSQEVIYTFAAKAIVGDYKGVHIMEQVLAARGSKQSYRSPEFPVRAVAEGYFALNSLKVTNDLYRMNVNRAMQNLSNRLTNDFGYNAVTVNDYMWIIDSRKHPEYTAHRKAFQQMNSILFSMNADTPIESVREQMKPVIAYFESIKKRYPSTSKHDRKIRYASFFNLSVLYYYLDDPKNMMLQANGLVLNDFDSKDGQVFEQSALRLKNQFQASNIYTRHFPININSFKGPYENSDEVSTWK